MILAGDIGGTSTRIGVFETAGSRLTPVVEEVYSSREHAGLDQIVRKFVSTHSLSITCASFGVAGPVRNGRSETPNPRRH